MLLPWPFLGAHRVPDRRPVTSAPMDAFAHVLPAQPPAVGTLWAPINSLGLVLDNGAQRD